MATMYDSGYGADMRADLYGQAATDEEERRRRERERQQAQQQFTQAQPASPMTQPQQQPGMQQNQQAQQQLAQAQQPSRDTRTFAQRQQAGEARPAPPPPQAPPQAPQMMPTQQNQQAQQLQALQQQMSGGGQPMQQMQPLPQGQMQQQMQALQQQMGAGGPQGAMEMPSLGMGMSPVSRFAPAPAAAMLESQQNANAMRQQQIANLTPDQQQLYQQAQALGPNVDPLSVAMGGQAAFAQAQQGMQIQQRMAAMTPQQQALSQQMAQQAQGMGLDPIAAMMDPEGFQRQLARMASGPAAMGGGGVNPDNIQPVGDGGFTGDIGSYLGGMLNGVTTGTVPDAYRPPNRIMDRAQELTDERLVNAPEVTQDLELMNQVRAMNGLPPLPSAGGAGGGAPAGVSGAGVNPAAALGGTPATGVEYGNAAIAANEIAAMQRREANGGIDPAAEAARASMGLPPSTLGGGAASSASSGAATPAGGGSVNSLTEQSIKDALQNPSAFDNEQVMNLYNRLGQDIDDQYRQQEVAMREEMARRGLSDSSIMGGRLADLNVGRRTASAELANRLGIQRAQDFANARAQAIGMGQQQRQNVFGEEMGRANVGIQQQGLSQAAARDAFNQKMQGMQFQNLLGQQQFANQMDRTKLQAALSGQGFQQGLQGLTFQNALGQQGFANDMARADLQRGRSNDAFSQRMGITDRLMGYGQQAFNNDMATQQFNAQQDNAYRNFMLQMLGLGG